MLNSVNFEDMSWSACWGAGDKVTSRGQQWDQVTIHHPHPSIRRSLQQNDQTTRGQSRSCRLLEKEKEGSFKIAPSTFLLSDLSPVWGRRACLPKTDQMPKAKYVWGPIYAAGQGQRPSLRAEPMQGRVARGRFTMCWIVQIHNICDTRVVLAAELMLCRHQMIHLWNVTRRASSSRRLRSRRFLTEHLKEQFPFYSY